MPERGQGGLEIALRFRTARLAVTNFTMKARKRPAHSYSDLQHKKGSLSVDFQWILQIYILFVC